MHSLQAPMPVTSAWYIRAEYLRNMQDLHGYAVRFYVDTIISEAGAPLQFSGWLENGACFERAPISALVTRTDTWLGDSDALKVKAGTVDDPPRPLHEHQPWNCFGDDFSVLVRDGWAGRSVAMRIGKEWARGSYLFTVDWPARECGYGHLGHKCAHVIAGDDGNVYALPNNLLCLLDPATVSRPFYATGQAPQILCREYAPSCEAHGGHAGEGDEFHYTVTAAPVPGASDATAVPSHAEDETTGPHRAADDDYVQRLLDECQELRNALRLCRAERDIQAAQVRNASVTIAQERDRLIQERDDLSRRLASVTR